MRFYKNILFLSLSFLVLFTSCRKDEIDSGKESTPQQPAIIVNGSISGIVTNLNNEPLPDVAITQGPHSAISDENGYFSFKNINLDERGSLLSAEKDGYFPNAKFVRSKLNKQNFTRIKMINKILTGSFESGSGGIITTSDGASITFPENGIKLDGGGNYSGSVNVYATWLDPTASDLAQRMPGDLRAFNEEEDQVQLTTYGMIGVELEGSGGEKLNLADGQTASIEFPVPSSLLGNAPDNIPLWYFNEANGYWEEEGSAVLDGNKYVGSVSHFSFWNCDVPSDLVFIEGLVTNENGGVTDVSIVISVVSSGISAVGSTDEEGFYSGYVPADEALIITINDVCGNEIYSAEIGPFAEDATIPTILVNIGSANLLTISGTLINCDDPIDNTVSNGYLLVTYDNQYTILNVDANGYFNSTISVCNATSITTKGYDLENIRQSNEVTHDITGISSLDLEEVSICEEIDEYLIYTINGVSFSVTEFQTIEESGLPFLIEASNPTEPNNVFSLTFDGFSEGQYTSTGLHMTGTDQILVYLATCEGGECSDVTVDISTFENPGGFIIGTMSGEVNNGGANSFPISADFKITRD